MKFIRIVNLFGGLNERRRAKELLSRLEVMPDLTRDELHRLTEATSIMRGTMSEHDAQIFAFGLHHRAITVTTNEKLQASTERMVRTQELSLRMPRCSGTIWL